MSEYVNSNPVLSREECTYIVDTFNQRDTSKRKGIEWQIQEEIRRQTGPLSAYTKSNALFLISSLEGCGQEKNNDLKYMGFNILITSPSNTVKRLTAGSVLLEESWAKKWIKEQAYLESIRQALELSQASLRHKTEPWYKRIFGNEPG